MDLSRQAREPSATYQDILKSPSRESLNKVVPKRSQASQMMNNSSQSIRAVMEVCVRELDESKSIIRAMLGSPKIDDAMKDQGSSPTSSLSTLSPDGNSRNAETELDPPYSNIGLTPHLRALALERKENLGFQDDHEGITSDERKSVSNVSPTRKAYDDWNLLPISPYSAKISKFEKKENPTKSPMDKTSTVSQLLLNSALDDIHNLYSLMDVVNISSEEASALICREFNVEAFTSYYRGYRMLLGNLFRRYKDNCQELHSLMEEIERRLTVAKELVIKPGREVYSLADPPSDQVYLFNEKLKYQLQKSKKHLGSLVNLLNIKVKDSFSSLVDIGSELKQLTEDFIKDEFYQLFTKKVKLEDSTFDF